MLKIQHNIPNRRPRKAILHRVADIPGGITVSLAKLGGGILLEGTPVVKGAKGLYEVVKTARVLKKVTATATTVDISKNSAFSVGDKLAVKGVTAAQKITKIERSDGAKDTLTLEATLGVEVLAGATIYEPEEGQTTPKAMPIAITGEDVAIDKNSGSLCVNAWVYAVVKEDVAPAVDETMKAAMKIVYV